MKYFFLLAVVAVFSACSSVKVSKVRRNEDLTNRFFYALPRNTLDVTINIKETVYEREGDPKWNKGCIPFLAEKYGLDPKVLEEVLDNKRYVKYTMISDSFAMALGNRADAEKIYAVNVDPRFFVDNVVGLTFTQDYILSEATISSENKAFELGLTTVSSLLGAVATLSKGELEKVAGRDHCDKFTKLDSLIAAYNGYITGPALPNLAEAYQTGKSLHNKRMEAEFAKVFYEKKETLRTIKFRFDPNDTMSNQTVEFFRINKQDGIVELNKALETRYTRTTEDRLEFKAVDAKDKDWYTLQFTRSSNDLLAKMESNGNNLGSEAETGLVYNVPRTAVFTIWKPQAPAPARREMLASNTYRVAQFGKTASINPKFTKASITLDPLTGALLKASGESKSLAPGNITGVGDLAGKGKAAFGGLTEEQELEKRAKILELKAKIKTLEAQQ